MNKKPIGAWESTTKGIGSKLLMKMGWQPGTGLGAKGTGRTEPVAAVMQPKGVGLGFLPAAAIDEPPRSKASVKQQDTRQQDNENKEMPERARKERRKRYTSAADLLREEDDLFVSHQTAETSKVKVLDMRGPDVREIDMSNVTSPMDMDETLALMDEGVDPMQHLPELQFNVQQLTYRTEQDLRTLSRSLRNEREKLKATDVRLEQMEAALGLNETDVRRVQEVTNALNGFHLSLGERMLLELDGDVLQMVLEDLNRDIAPLFEHGHAAAVPEAEMAVISILQPFVQRYTRDWNPLEQPEYALALYQWCRKHCHSPSDKSQASAFEALMWHVWLPKVRSSVNNQWQPREYDPAIAFVDCWKPVLTYHVLDNVLHQLIWPKLQQAIDEWNPRVDREPLHVWMFPWLPLLGDKLEMLFPPIRHKMSTMLRDANPAEDDTALNWLQPWLDVFDRKSMDGLIMDHVLPKLHLMMHEWTIDPRHQDVEPLRTLLRWRPFLSSAELHRILKREFFSKWLGVLHQWLSANEKSSELFTEIQEWYRYWKSEFPADLASDPQMQACFTLALNMMNQAVADGDIDQFLPWIERLAHHEEEGKTKKNHPATPSQSTSAPLITFRETVEAFASRHNISFTPTNKHAAHGALIFKFGRSPVYLKDGLIYAHVNGPDFIPVSFEQLLLLQDH